MGLKPWRVLESRILVDSPWVRLRSDRCERADGQIIDPYYVAERRDWVCVLALTPSREAVVTTEYRHGAGVVMTGLPAGMIETTDASPEAAARRELLEETGFAVDRLEMLGRLWAAPANQGNRTSFFIGLGARRVAGQSLDLAEEIEVETMPFDALLASGRFSATHDMACLLMADRWLRAQA